MGSAAHLMDDGEEIAVGQLLCRVRARDGRRVALGKLRVGGFVAQLFQSRPQRIAS